MFALLALAFAADTAPPTSAPALALVCKVAGQKSTAEDLRPSKVCARFRYELEKRLGKKIRLAASAPSGTGDWVRIDVRVLHADTVTATLSQKRRGKLVTHPAQSISVSDREISIHMVGQLARVVAAQIKLR